MIRKAKISELNLIYKLSQDCARAMITQGIRQWNDHYPTKEHFEKDIKAQELYILEKDTKLIGVIVLTEVMDEEYKSITWLTDNGKNLYIHRLAVHPDYWGQGLAQNLMSFAEEYAKDNNYKSVRLDTLSENKRNLKFYKKRGYTQLGDIFFPKQNDHPFHCFELVL